MKKLLFVVSILFVSFAMPVIGITVVFIQDVLTERELMCGILFGLVFLSAMTVVIAVNIKELIKK